MTNFWKNFSWKFLYCVVKFFLFLSFPFLCYKFYTSIVGRSDVNLSRHTAVTRCLVFDVCKQVPTEKNRRENVWPATCWSFYCQTTILVVGYTWKISLCVSRVELNLTDLVCWMLCIVACYFYLFILRDVINFIISLHSYVSFSILQLSFETKFLSFLSDLVWTTISSTRHTFRSLNFLLFLRRQRKDWTVIEIIERSRGEQ